jgi:hypothetical protein
VARFCLDEDVAMDVALLLTQAGHDALSSVSSLDLRHIGDYDVLRIIARDRRILVTHNAEDFVLLHHAWRRWSRDWGIDPTHAGILVPLQRLGLRPNEIVFRLDELLATGWALTNELYLFTGLAGGWVRIPEPPEPNWPR